MTHHPLPLSRGTFPPFGSFMTSHTMKKRVRRTLEIEEVYATGQNRKWTKKRRSFKDGYGSCRTRTLCPNNVKRFHFLKSIRPCIQFQIGEDPFFRSGNFQKHLLCRDKTFAVNEFPFTVQWTTSLMAFMYCCIMIQIKWYARNSNWTDFPSIYCHFRFPIW